MTENTLEQMKNQVEDLGHSIDLLNRQIESGKRLDVLEIAKLIIVAKLHERWTQSLFSEVVSEIKAENKDEEDAPVFRGGGAMGNVCYSFKPMPSWEQKDR